MDALRLEVELLWPRMHLFITLDRGRLLFLHLLVLVVLITISSSFLLWF
jgi:hypothetical protein